MTGLGKTQLNLCLIGQACRHPLARKPEALCASFFLKASCWLDSRHSESSTVLTLASMLGLHSEKDSVPRTLPSNSERATKSTSRLKDKSSWACAAMESQIPEEAASRSAVLTVLHRPPVLLDSFVLLVCCPLQKPHPGLHRRNPCCKQMHESWLTKSRIATFPRRRPLSRRRIWTR